jgi:hypothetical protein
VIYKEKTDYKLINKVLNAFNNKRIVGSVRCDLTKAFDCAKNDILISSIEKCGNISKGEELKSEMY